MIMSKYYKKPVIFSLLRHAFHTSVPLKCGVLSYFYSSPSSSNHVETDRQALLKGLETLKHRGPDGAPSVWIDAAKTVGLGHTRLAVIDLSEQGRQPLHSRDNQLHLAMNGELYDHDRIRRQAIDNGEYQFVSESDNEIAMHLYRKYGVEFPKHLRGEFAITMYDEQRKVVFDQWYQCRLDLISSLDVHGRTRSIRHQAIVLHVSRTETDLCLGDQSTVCLRVSCLKAWFRSSASICSVPAIWNEEMIYNIGLLQSLQTIYKNIQQLPPGYILIATDNGTINLSKYYDVSYITRQEERDEQRSEEEMISGVRERLLEAIRLRMRADVKVGVYLSGGLDSSAVLGMATSFTDQPIDTYSISFKGDPYFDEKSLCDSTNAYLGPTKTRPHMIELTHHELADHLEDCIYHYEQPLMHSSAVGKFLLSKLVNQNGGKVVLTGEGSDEIFSG